MEIEVFYFDETDPVILAPEKEEKVTEVVVIWENEPPKELSAIAQPIARSAGNIYPKEIEEIKIRQGELYRHKCKLANELVDMVDSSTIEQRRDLVAKILANKEEYNQLAIAVKTWEKTGELPKKEEKIKLTDLQKHELLRKRMNVAANISKKKNLVRKYQHQPTKLVKYQNQQAKLEAELSEIDELLRQ